MESASTVSTYIVSVFVLAASVLYFLLRTRKAVPPLPPAAAHAAAAPQPAAKRGRMLILWGSQTGTAEAFAKTLELEARERGFAAEHVDLEVRRARARAHVPAAPPPA